ncbi:MAG: YjcQ family protein [Pelotomaculum sp.]|jgi:hypothetical protein
MSNEDRILLAIFEESKKPTPDMGREITTAKLDMDTNVFNMAVKKLSDDGLIKGANIVQSGDRVVAVFTKDITITDAGKERASKLQ